MQSLRECLDTTVADKDGETLGRLEDALLDPASGRVAYGMVASGEVRYAIPWRALRTTKDGLSVALRRDEMTALALDPQFWPGMAGDERWARQLHQRFGVGPYWDPATWTSEDA